MLDFLSSNEPIDLDRIAVNCVTKQIDKDLEIFRDSNLYWIHTVDQVFKFMIRLPSRYAGEHIEFDRKESNQGLFSFEGSPNDIKIYTQPGFPILKTDEEMSSPGRMVDGVRTLSIDDTILSPTFLVSFDPIDRKSTRKILGAITRQFFVIQKELDDGTFSAIAQKDGEVVLTGMDIFREYHPNLRRIHARLNYGMGRGEATYWT